MRNKFSIRLIDEKGFHKSLCKEFKFCFYFDYDDLILFKTKEKAIEFFENNIQKKNKCRYYIYNINTIGISNITMEKLFIIFNTALARNPTSL